MKIFLKNLAIPFLSNQLVSSIATHLIGSGIPVFMLHRMYQENQRSKGTTTQHLRNCLSYLKKNKYTFISLETLILSLENKVTLPKKSVVFTMDDGYQDQAEIAVPIFLEFGCPLTFFIITDLVEGKQWPWDAQVSWIVDNTLNKNLTLNLDDETIEVEINNKDNRHNAREMIRNQLKEISVQNIPEIIKTLTEDAKLNLPIKAPEIFQPLTWNIARELETKGVQFAPHSKSHNILSKMDRDSCEQEILGSWNVLQKELVHPLKVFCYPTGRVLDYGPREIEILRQAGFIGAVSTTPGYYDFKLDYEEQIYRIPRFEFPDNINDFIQCCSWIEFSKGQSLSG